MRWFARACLLKYLQLRQLTICTPADETDASETRVDAVLYNYCLNIVQRRQSYCDTCQICRVCRVYSYLIVDASAMFTPRKVNRSQKISECRHDMLRNTINPTSLATSKFLSRLSDAALSLDNHDCCSYSCRISTWWATSSLDIAVIGNTTGAANAANQQSVCFVLVTQVDKLIPPEIIMSPCCFGCCTTTEQRKANQTA